ncbi:MAG: hypothetical protein EA366_06575 [Spirulina sp. DLM2.Bin59]|nr:MAG: hypothetical protein EA366_06575 [Spirulina sp. DLM2.Bin59]
MAENLIDTQIVPKQIVFKPGGSPVGFEVVVVNLSDRFAGFQVEVQAAGANPVRQRDWYAIAPEVSAKIPPGDGTHFQVQLLDSPVPGFVGLMNMTVRVFSLELADEDREVIQVQVEQGQIPIPLQLMLPITEFRAAPGDQVEIPLKVYNPSQLPTLALLRLQGFNAAWLPQGNERRLEIGPGQEIAVAFVCQLPDVTQTISQRYPFTVIASHSQGPPGEANASLEISPAGRLTFAATPSQHRIPHKWGWLPGWYGPPVEYQLRFENRSNLPQNLTVEWLNPQEGKGVTCNMTPESLMINPGETDEMVLAVKGRRPWLRGRSPHPTMGALLSDQRLGNASPGQHSLKLQIAPILPLWTVVGLVPLLVYILWALSWLNPDNRNYGHQEGVNAVALDGLATKVISGSTDQDIRIWRSEAFNIPWLQQDLGLVGQAGKAVRAIAYRPVDNNQVVVGLENGDIQIWDLLSDRKLDNFFYRKDDRVLALIYGQDARFVYSGHGSGLVLAWDVDHDLDDLARLTPGAREPARSQSFNFAVYGLAFVDAEEEVLAVTGRYNQLVFWNLNTDDQTVLPFRRGGQDDYIFTVTTPDMRSHILATGDNQGWITIWDVTACLPDIAAGRAGGPDCEIIDQWPEGHGGEPVQSLALSHDGCYLVSGGQDGQVKVWPLNRNGTRAARYPDGIWVAQTRSYRQGNPFWGPRITPPIRSVAVKSIRNQLIIASGGEDSQVRVNAVNRPEAGCNPMGGQQ